MSLLASRTGFDALPAIDALKPLRSWAKCPFRTTVSAIETGTRPSHRPSTGDDDDCVRMAAIFGDPRPDHDDSHTLGERPLIWRRWLSCGDSGSLQN